MGNTQKQPELTQEELEKFEMEVDEEYNPTGLKSDREARLEYMQRLRQREA